VDKMLAWSYAHLMELAFSASEKFHFDFANFKWKSDTSLFGQKLLSFRAFNVIDMLFRWKSTSCFS